MIPDSVLSQYRIDQPHCVVDTLWRAPSTLHFTERFDIAYWSGCSGPGIVRHAGRLIHVGPFLVAGTLVEIHLGLRRRSRRQNCWCLCGLADVPEDALDHPWLFDEEQRSASAQHTWDIARGDTRRSVPAPAGRMMSHASPQRRYQRLGSIL